MTAGAVAVRLGASAVLAVVLLVGAAAAGAGAAGSESGKVEVSYTYGEVLVDEEGEYTVSPSSALGVEFARRTGPRQPGGPELACEGYFSVGASPATKSGLTLGLDWQPLEGSLSGRRYSVNASLSGRWPGEAGRPPEEAWEIDAAVQERGLGAAALEAGGRAGAHLNRLTGPDYREAAAYLATRFVLDGEPCGLAWVEPEWLRGFAALFAPPPEPGAEERSDLPYWFEAAALPGLPPLPPPEVSPASSAEPRLARLTVTTRHTQTCRAYTENPSNDWEAGETRLEVRERRGRGEVAASYRNTVKFYPAGATRTYRLAEGKLEVSGPAGPGRGRAAVGFRQRFPWEGSYEAYRQHGVDLGYTLPGTAVDWRFGGEWRLRRYEAEPEKDYSFTSLQGGISWPAEAKRGGPAASVTLAATEERHPAGTRPAEYRLRLRLRGELPTGPGQTLSAGLGWERAFSLPPGGALTPGSTETLFRLVWRRSF
ncbi:MAG: hypothetical protein QME79_07980 [Bacillota bacterium]|nr:hypothetical protein [Bacillota bacterium]